MKKICVLLIVIMLPAVLLTANGCGTSATKGTEMKVVRTAKADADGANPAKEGKLYRTGKVPVLALEGTYRQMGWQYGALLRDEMRAMNNRINNDYGKLPGLTRESMLQTAESIYNGAPRELKDLIDGAADSSSLPGRDDQKILNAIEFYLPYTLARPGCSGCAAWGDYTGRGPLVFGRNYDYMPEMKDTLVVAAFKPAGGEMSWATIAYAGVFMVTTAINGKGMFMEMNSGDFSSPETNDFSQEFGECSFFSFTRERVTLDDLEYAVNATRTNMGFVLNAAYRDDAASFEWATSAARRHGPNAPGLLVATNDFIDPSWAGVPGIQEVGTGPKFGYTQERRENLLKLAEENKGHITPEVMMKMMATPLEAGGPLLQGMAFVTDYQVVAVPSQLKVWVRVPGYQEWTPVALTTFL